MAAPAPRPEVPFTSLVVSIVTFVVIVILVDAEIAPAVNIVPARDNALGALIVREPSTVNVLPLKLLIVKLPVLLNVRLYEEDPDVPITDVAFVPPFNTKL